MEFQQNSPMAKFEHSPAESLMSIPGDNYTSLFAVTTPSASSTMNPMEMMTPKSYIEDKMSPSFPTIKEEEGAATTPSPSPAPEKKNPKKRKSWGQVLPEPKTNLPPRKRAKTEDEKEQRRVERVLRNRRAAQSSRERKRLEVEALEKRNLELEEEMNKMREHNMKLMSELNEMRRSSGMVTHSTSTLESLRENPSLSQELFSSQKAHSAMGEIISPNATVDPTALSPNLSPVADSSEEPTTQEPSKEAKPEQTESTSPDLTQLSHVGGDAQVVPGVANLDAANLGLAPAASDDAAFSLGDAYCMPTAYDADRFVLENGYLSSPNSSCVGDDYLVGDAPAFNLNDDFDISFFLNDDATAVPSESMAASDFPAAIHGLEPKVYEPEIQISSENPIQQPHPGASSSGCDVGGIAVGV
ncbi:transcription factor that binds to CRE motif [Fusarium torreyae]|uniref:Transcription factor that binds to CRE motif n=1 Tax=Fusarium torreyae TaxID=1237075 RepID=A0A9W8RTZ9_9HYPO|nr:transcription factor that binds to CRE motif [Fusarium torreyae]